MDYNTVYKLACAQDPSAATASACAAVGLPQFLTKTSGLGSQVMKLVGRGARRRAGRISEQMSRKPLSGAKTYKETVKSKLPRSLEIAQPRRGEIDVESLMELPTGMRPMPKPPRPSRGMSQGGEGATRAVESPGAAGATQVAPADYNRWAKSPGRAVERPVSAEAAQQAPGWGSRIAKNWWTLPVAGAGVYGVGQALSPLADIAGSEEGYGAPAPGPSPAEGRYQQMMQLARQYGYG